MDFPSRLENIDKKLRDKWNDEIEEFLGKPPSSSSDIIPLKEFDDDAVKSSLEAIALVLQIELLAYNTQNETAKIDEYIGDAVRTGKNLLRWFIQIYLEQRRGRRESGGTIDYLRSIDILSNIVGILKWSVDTKDNTKLARDSSLFIFYATFSQFPGDVIASKGINHLITELSFPSLSLEILMKTNSVALALSLVRNLHSMVVSFPGAQKVILNTEIQWDPSTAMKSAPWAIEEPFTINLSLSCLELMKWSLDAPPSFPDENSEDKRAELVIEILNLFYALRKGQELVDTTTNNSVLANAVVRILQLPFPAQTNDDNENDNGIVVKRIEQCKLSAISILMDSDASFGKYLLEIGSLDALLQILKRQVDNVVDNTRIDSAATAAIVPILAVLNKYSMANSDVQQQVKAFVFPSETEKLYQQAVKENRKTKMSPLDAPKDSLRGKIVVLLSWVDGYIKRCSAELMWTLCNSDYSEYTCRVGMGNALTLLNSKGLSPVQIPT